MDSTVGTIPSSVDATSILDEYSTSDNLTNSMSSKLFPNFINTKNNINFLHLNIHYLHPKFDEVKHLLHQNKNLDILGLCETFLNDHFSSSEFMLPNYQLYRKDRKSNGGGVILYIKSSIPGVQRTDLDKDNIEAIWVEIKCEKQKPFIIGYVYRPPASKSNWTNDMEEILETIYREDKEIIIFGDFNYNFINNELANHQWNSVVNSFMLKQIIYVPTRVTSSSSTIIDHVYTNNPGNITNISVPSLSISDHYPVCFSKTNNVHSNKNHLHTLINYRCMNYFCVASF